MQPTWELSSKIKMLSLSLLKVNMFTRNKWAEKLKTLSENSKMLMMKDLVHKSAFAQVPKTKPNASAHAPHKTRMDNVNLITT